jgi:GT2 family glycosyltransferase
MKVDTIKLADVPDERRPVLDDISVVIPTLGRPILESALAWIAVGATWPSAVIVVDQGSSREVDGWLRWLHDRGLETVWVPSDRQGRSAGVNVGLERAETHFVAVTDDDCFVEKEWLTRMRERLRRRPRSIVSGRVEGAGDDVGVAVVTDRVEKVQQRPSLRFDRMSGGNMGTSQEVLDLVGPFDEDPRLRHAEDCDWSYRALRAGIPIVYAPEVCILHYGWRDEGERVGQYRAYARSHGGFYGKHLRRGDAFIALRAGGHYLRALRRWARGIVTGDRERRAHGRAYVTGLLPGILAGLRRPEGR